MDFKYHIVSSMCKVFPDGANQRELKEKNLTALKGETLSFQIAYYWSGEGKNYGSLKVSSPIKDHVHVRMVNLVPCEYPCHPKRDDGYLTTVPGMYPDRLSQIPQQGFPLIAGQWRCLWIDIETDMTIEAGIYPVILRLESNGMILCDAKMTCTVIDVPLPKLPIAYTEWFHSDCLAEYYQTEVFSDYYWEIVESFVRAAAKHKCNMLLTPIFTPPLDTAIGKERLTVQLVDVTVSSPDPGSPQNPHYEFGFSNFHKWVNMALECGIEYFELSHLFSQWGAKAAPKVMALKDGVYQQIFGWETDASGSTYREFLHQFLTALKGELDKMGIASRTYFHISDEPPMDELPSYRRAWESIAEDLKGYKIIDALSDYDFYQEELVQRPVCAVDALKPFLENRPEHLWCYYCTAQCVDVPNHFIALPGCRTRILGVLLYKYRLDGFLHWGYNFYHSELSHYRIDPYQCTDAAGAFPSGDPFLVYPGKDGKPEGSIRQMLLDEAMSDYCALTALENLAGRDAVLKLVNEETVTFDKYPQEETYLFRLRQKVNHALQNGLAR